MTVTWHLRGFDKQTEYLAVEYDISRSSLPVVRQVLPEAKEDPEFVDPWEITSDQAARLAAELGLAIDPDLYYYSVESDEDPYVVAAKVQAMRAKA